VFKGSVPSFFWNAWAPVQRDGRYRFAALPRGRLMLSGAGTSWLTSSSLDLGSIYQAWTMVSEPVIEINLETLSFVKQRVRLLLPDGAPAAGATISFVTISGLSPTWHSNKRAATSIRRMRRPMRATGA